MTRAIRLELPYPPSVNALHRTVRGRPISSAKYRAWAASAAAMIHQQLREPDTIEGHYHLYIRATAPDRRRRDLGNLEKSISDSLVDARVIADDCNARVIISAWAGEPKKPGSIEVIVTEAA
ncbi:MAG: RusA family crossover junction endodeoxyribonuclease [Parcubacteria group bacterium]